MPRHGLVLLRQVVMVMLRNREQRRYQNHIYDAPSYLHLVHVQSIPRHVAERFYGFVSEPGVNAGTFSAQ